MVGKGRVRNLRGFIQALGALGGYNLDRGMCENYVCIEVYYPFSPHVADVARTTVRSSHVVELRACGKSCHSAPVADPSCTGLTIHPPKLQSYALITSGLDPKL